MNAHNIRVGATYRMGGQHKYLHRVISIVDHPQVPGEKRVVTLIVRPDGSLGANNNQWALSVFVKRTTEEVGADAPLPESS